MIRRSCAIKGPARREACNARIRLEEITSPAAQRVTGASATAVYCNNAAAEAKDDIASMEHPLYSLVTAPEMRHLEYRSGDYILKIRPSGLGPSTIFDKDILIFTISHLTARENRREPRILLETCGGPISEPARSANCATRRGSSFLPT